MSTYVQFRLHANRINRERFIWVKMTTLNTAAYNGFPFRSPKSFQTKDQLRGEAKFKREPQKRTQILRTSETKILENFLERSRRSLKSFGCVLMGLTAIGVLLTLYETERVRIQYYFSVAGDSRHLFTAF